MKTSKNEMERQIVIIPAGREAYAPEEIDGMTARELAERLREMPDDAVLVLSHDGGYTFGGIRSIRLATIRTDED